MIPAWEIFIIEYRLVKISFVRRLHDKGISYITYGAIQRQPIKSWQSINERAMAKYIT